MLVPPCLRGRPGGAVEDAARPRTGRRSPTISRSGASASIETPSGRYISRHHAEPAARLTSDLRCRSSISRVPSALALVDGSSPRRRVARRRRSPAARRPRSRPSRPPPQLVEAATAGIEDDARLLGGQVDARLSHARHLRQRLLDAAHAARRRSCPRPGKRDPSARAAALMERSERAPTCRRRSRRARPLCAGRPR